MIIRFTLNSTNAVRVVEMPCVPRVGESVQWDTINAESREILTETAFRVEEVTWSVIEEINGQPGPQQPQVSALVFLVEDPDVPSPSFQPGQGPGFDTE